MLIAELSFLFWLALSFQWEFNCKGSLKIAGIREKLDCVCALDAMVSKTDINDLFWHFSIKHVVLAKATFFPSWFYRPAHQLKHSDITLIEKCQNRSRISVFLPWRPGHTQNSTSHVLFNVQRAFKVELSLESKRESEKEKRARQSTFNARHNTT